MRQPSITIIGAGFGGLGTAVELRRAGFRDITVLEKADGVGGVWRENTYPNAACDVPSSLYSWSFAPNPGWPHRYSRQDEILAYIERTAREQGVLDLVRTGVEVTSAAYDEPTGSWRLTTADDETIDSDVVITAVGQLSRPSIPDLPGIDSFTGPAFHSAEWDHSVDLRGKRIAVLGTGASAIQFVPGIQPEAGHITVFQRSAPYVVPKPDREYTPTHGKLFRRYPATQSFGRKLTWVLSEQLNRSLVGRNPTKLAMKLAWRAQLRTQVRDPQLRRKLRPDYPLGCKRLLFSTEWYPALVQPNVAVVTESVVEVLPEGVRSADGVVHEVDAIIYGTGFAATEFLAPIQFTGVRRCRPALAVEGGRARLPRPVRAGLPEPVRGLRTEHQPRRQLDHQHARVRVGGHLHVAASHGVHRCSLDRRESRGGAALRRGDPEPPRRHRVGKLPQLVPRGRRPDHHELARPGGGVPASLRRARPRRLRHHLSTASTTNGTGPHRDPVPFHQLTERRPGSRRRR